MFRTLIYMFFIKIIMHNSHFFTFRCFPDYWTYICECTIMHFAVKSLLEIIYFHFKGES